MVWGELGDEEIAEAATLLDVPLRRDRMQWVECATRDAIRHFAWGIGDPNPLWTDEGYAAATRYGGIIAPPCFLYAVDYTVVAPKLPGVQWIYAGTDWTWYDVVRRDDCFEVDARLVDQSVKSGRTFERWLLQTGRIRFSSDSGLVAECLGHCARTPRQVGGEDEVGGVSPAHRYSPAELADIESSILSEECRGAEPLYWDDVAVDDQLPGVVKGPLSIIDIVAWYSATQGAQPYGGVHGDALRYRRRHDDYHLNRQTGAKDAAGRGHLEEQTGKDVGMGGVYDVGPQRISWAGHMVSNWIGDEGFLHRLDVKVTRPNLVGDTTWWRGVVTAKWVDDETHLLSLDVSAVNQRGDTTASGVAVIVLPAQQGGVVQLPLPRRFEIPRTEKDS